MRYSLTKSLSFSGWTWTYNPPASASKSWRGLPCSVTSVSFVRKTVSLKNNRKSKQIRGNQRVENAKHSCYGRWLNAIYALCHVVTWGATGLASRLGGNGSFLQCASRTTCKSGVLMTILIKNHTSNSQAFALVFLTSMQNTMHTMCPVHTCPVSVWTHFWCKCLGSDSAGLGRPWEPTLWRAL